MTVYPAPTAPEGPGSAMLVLVDICRSGNRVAWISGDITGRRT